MLRAGRNVAGTAEREMQFFQLQAVKDALLESNGISYSPAEFLGDLRVSIAALLGLTLVNWQLDY